MIRISSIRIEEFRGIRLLSLKLAAKSFAICGSNGTGKSGVVDAIEFCLTGDITRLSGPGTAELSVKKHAAHVDRREHTEKSRVTIEAVISGTNKALSISRSVKDPGKVSVSPDNPETAAIVAELQTHPEFALSRREIIKYIITPPNQRSSDVQTLLRLNYLEELRKSLISFRNSCKNRSGQAATQLSLAQTELKSLIDDDDTDDSSILKAINERRKILDLDPIAALHAETSFQDGVPSSPELEERTPLVKAEALVDIQSLKSTMESILLNDKIDKHSEAAKEIFSRLAEDEHLLRLAKQQGFFNAGLELIVEDACPLCDTEWEPERLREHLRNKLKKVAEVTSLVDELKNNLEAMLDTLSKVTRGLERVIHCRKKMTPPLPDEPIFSYLGHLKDVENSIREFINNNVDIPDTHNVVAALRWPPTREHMTAIDESLAAVIALPDSSPRDQARDFLIVAQERYRRLSAAVEIAKEESAQNIVAENALAYFITAMTKRLDSLYDRVADDFSRYYQIINREDEADFSSKLKPHLAKLSLDVDFYGRGKFPPGAYHSEGHQDAMGLCLYLALMKHTLQGNFTFAVLDDVLMSVDSGHRRDVCRLLLSEFRETQFILTTHDRVWLRFMKTEGLIDRSQSFGSWSVDTGPMMWDDDDIWDEITVALEADDVPRAAWLLRHYLEYSATVLADNLRAHVEFSGNGQYDLNDLLPPVLKAWKTKLVAAEKSAQYWGKPDQAEEFAKKRAEAKELIANTESERWAINPSVHYNSWANLESHEFIKVVAAFECLFEHLRCHNPSCKSYLYVLPHKGDPEVLRCNCGTTNINLKAKS